MCRGQNFDLKYHHTPPGFHKSEKNTRRGKDSKNVKKSADGKEGMWYSKKKCLLIERKVKIFASEMWYLLQKWFMKSILLPFREKKRNIWFHLSDP